jgi:hypothetical protein
LVAMVASSLSVEGPLCKRGLVVEVDRSTLSGPGGA